MATISITRGPAAPFVLLLVAACASAPTPAPRVASARSTPTPLPRHAGLVLGQTARELEAAFGKPSSVLTEGAARRLQFAGGTCVLDAYLYPMATGEPAVTHVDTRRPTGEDIDRAQCVAALRQRL